VETRVAVIVPFESPPGASIDQLVELVAADMERVNVTILSRTGSEVTMIPEVANHLISSGGKRLRPMLTLAMAGLAGYSGDGHIKLAASVEFMHTATLLHDDVVDESELRRGKLSARMLWGNEASVLVGDFLLGQAFRMMVEVGSLRALDILSSAAATIAEGEVMQLAAAKNTATTEDEYLAVIRGKTAELFAAACEVGPVIANRPTMAARPPSSARTSATISARARSRCRWCWRSAAAMTASAPSGSRRWSGARSAAAISITPSA
jgi:octaprenyl-diphosphate synthase